MIDTDVFSLYLPPSDWATRYAGGHLMPNLHRARFVPFKQVSSGTWAPEAHWCHRNVDQWTKFDDQARFVPGWIVVDYRSVYGFVRFMAHTVVGSDISDDLYDITPSDAEGRYPFLECGIDVDTYFKFEKQLIDVYGVSRFDFQP